MYKEDYETLKTYESEGILTVTFNYKKINVLGIPMLKDLNKLCNYLESNEELKVVIFNSSNDLFFIAHADIDMLKNMKVSNKSKDEIGINDLAKTLDRINKLSQVTISQVEGYARGGGHEFILACDMRFATPNAVFMQMECGMGILPCGGGSARLARVVGLPRALEIILCAEDFNAKEAYRYGTINKVIESDKISDYVYTLAKRISKFPLRAIKACKKTIYKSIDLDIDKALKEESYQLAKAISITPAIKRFTYASDINFQYSIYNQKNFSKYLMDFQNIK
ncbi:MAG: enoyl-CoA hydratase/isomerase family protein [bacterium]